MNQFKTIFKTDINNLASIYLLYGEDKYLLIKIKEQFINKYISDEVKDFNYTFIDEGEDFVVQVKNKVNTPPIFSSKRFIIARTFNYFVKKNTDDQILIKLFDNFPDSSILLILVEGKIDNRIKIVGRAKKIAKVIKVDPPRSHELDQWVKEEFQKRGKVIDNKSVKFLEKMFNNNLAILNSEIEKICTYLFNKNKISFHEVKEIISRDRILEDNAIFDLTDALINNNKAQALFLLKEIIDNGAFPLIVLSTILWQLRLLMMVQDLKSQGKDPYTIARELKSHHYPVKKCYQACNKYTSEELELMLERFLQANLNIVSGKYEAAMALEMAVLGQKKEVYS